ncbi:separase-like protein [Tanacetum coccineum]
MANANSYSSKWPRVNRSTYGLPNKGYFFLLFLFQSSYLPSSSHCLRLPPQRVKDLENFILNFFNDLPEITIVCMNFLEDGIEKLLYELLPHSDTKTWIMLSRLNSRSIPISRILPIRKMWKRPPQGTTKTKPSVEELSAALSAHDLYIYFSHGSGEQLIAAKFIQKMNKCLAALLMGCDSGRLTLCGSLAPKGAPTHYLLGGSPAILCNLWTMGDRDVGRFTKDLVLDLINKANTGHAQRLHNPDEEGPSKKRNTDAPMNIGSFLIKCRKSCDLRYLTGASTVSYGLPTSICRKDTR